MRKTLPALLAVLGLCTAACQAQTTEAGHATAASATALQEGLLTVHDPGEVTGTVPASCHVLTGPRPDPACTPGAIDPAVTQANIGSTICASGWTATVRPPTSATDRRKAQMYRVYGIAEGTVSELDHAVPLELGGANDVANLWPEVGKLPNQKDKVENDLKRAVCSGRVSLAPAQQAIAEDWLKAEDTLGVS